MVQGDHLRNYVWYRLGRALTDLSGGHSYTGGGCSCIQVQKIGTCSSCLDGQNRVNLKIL